MSHKKYLSILAVGVALFLSACSVKGKDDLEKIKPEEESRTEEQQTNGQTQPGSVPEENPTEEEPDGYEAVRDIGFDMVFDYDGIIELCEAACGEYAQAVRNPKDANFDVYIQNENLKTYCLC